MKKKVRRISDKTILTALVNYKCVGYFGKCLTPLTMQERCYVTDELQRRGYLDKNLNIMPAAEEIILQNLNLLQY